LLSHAHAGQHLRDVTHISLVNACWAAQMAFVFGGFLGQDVALERLAAFHSAAWANAKTFLRAALGLHFGHDCSEISVLITFEACCSLETTLVEPASVLYWLDLREDSFCKSSQAHDYKRFLRLYQAMALAYNLRTTTEPIE
jgi:hypothetical protein